MILLFELTTAIKHEGYGLPAPVIHNDAVDRRIGVVLHQSNRGCLSHQYNYCPHDIRRHIREALGRAP